MQIIHVTGPQQGIDRAFFQLNTLLDKDTVLFLSGGKTPFGLYRRVAQSELTVGAAALIDERFGPTLHRNSNELMIKKSGLIAYFEKKNIPFFHSLSTVEKSFEGATFEYEKTVDRLFSTFSKSVGIFGIGTDGHTAGILPNRPGFVNPAFSSPSDRMVIGVYDAYPLPGGFENRITLTPKAIERIQTKIILAFGEDKKIVLKKFVSGREMDQVKLPSLVLLHPNHSSVILITDQRVGIDIT